LAAYKNGQIQVIPRENQEGHRLDLRGDIGIHYEIAEKLLPEK
jgi:hypothetical protein